MAAEIFQLLGKIGLDGVEETNKDIDGVSDKAGKLGAVFEKAGQIAIGVGKAVAVGMGAAATAVGAIIKASVDGYSEYEQLVGGVDTLFKNSSEQVQRYAARAYRTAGMTANEYMSTVTSFSASLLQGLDGDTAEAAKIADMAIQDMADNANKMGTSMEAVQNAYQGFAKQNYTMLDNLKLGYGGTKTEMQRLLKDAQAITGIKYDINNLSDVYEAIHVIQTELEITGTTAKEAMETIQGSTAATKSAWQNLIVGFAADNQNLDALVKEFVDSAIVMIGNIADRIQEILPRLVKGLELLIAELTPFLTELVETMLPGLIQGATTLFIGLIEALPDILQILIEQIPFILTSIGAALIEAFPVLLETVKMLFGQIWDYIAENLFGVEGNFDETFAKVTEIFNNAWAVLQETWTLLGEPIWNTIQSMIQTVRNAFSEHMPEIREFVSNCFGEISSFWENNLKPCFEAIGNFLETKFAPWFDKVFNNAIVPAVRTAFSFISDLWNNVLKPILTGITDFLTGVFSGNWKQAFEGLVSIVSGVWSGLVTVIKTPINAVIGIINSFISGLNRLTIPDWIPLVGGKGINIPLIPELEEGGILEKGQVGFLEGNGAEAVVPLDQNKKWINQVAMDMNAAIGGTESTDLLRRILDAITAMDDAMAEKLTTAVADIRLDINNREFARMVRAVN